ncbi:hypothetical protein MMPV_008194 [Pyropia vietnamensis]
MTAGARLGGGIAATLVAPDAGPPVSAAAAGGVLAVATARAVVLWRLHRLSTSTGSSGVSSSGGSGGGVFGGVFGGNGDGNRGVGVGGGLRPQAVSTLTAPQGVTLTDVDVGEGGALLAVRLVRKGGDGGGGGGSGGGGGGGGGGGRGGVRHPVVAVLLYDTASLKLLLRLRVGELADRAGDVTPPPALHAAPATAAAERSPPRAADERVTAASAAATADAVVAAAVPGGRRRLALVSRSGARLGRRWRLPPPPPPPPPLATSPGARLAAPPAVCPPPPTTGGDDAAAAAEAAAEALLWVETPAAVRALHPATLEWVAATRRTGSPPTPAAGLRVLYPAVGGRTVRRGAAALLAVAPSPSVGGGQEGGGGQAVVLAGRAGWEALVPVGWAARWVNGGETPNPSAHGDTKRDGVPGGTPIAVGIAALRQGSTTSPAANPIGRSPPPFPTRLLRCVASGGGAGLVAVFVGARGEVALFDPTVAGGGRICGDGGGGGNADGLCGALDVRGVPAVVAATDAACRLLAVAHARRGVAGGGAWDTVVTVYETG